MRQMIAFLVVTAISTVAAAQPAADPLETCAQQSDAAARLACFDQEMQRRHATNTRPEASAPAPHAATAAAPSTTTAPVTATPHAAAPAAAASTAAAATAPSTAAAHADENVGLEGAQLRKKLREQGVVEESHKPNPIVAQVSRAVEHPDHRYTFVLDNGQVWEQVENKQGLFVDAHETVTITPGVLGSFFLRTSKRLYLRVRRVQ